jgi:hypothetical protein
MSTFYIVDRAIYSFIALFDVILLQLDVIIEIYFVEFFHPICFVVVHDFAGSVVLIIKFTEKKR